MARATSTILLSMLLAAGFAGCSSPEIPPAPVASAEFQLVPLLDGLDRPVWAGAPANDSRLFIAEQRGLLYSMEPDAEPEVFLDIRTLTRSGGERGLLGVAFSPQFDETGEFFVHHSDREGNTVIARYAQDPATGIADPDSRLLVLHVEQPYSNHNGGAIAFGPDGLLYVGLGDGGLAGDPQNNGQNPDTLLGAILRLRVVAGEPSLAYRVPADNPFGNEVYVWGVRNPWRFSFDAETGDLWVADVGQNHVEEVTRIPADQIAGANLGWNWFEGSFRYRESGTPPEDTIKPQAEYDHDGGHCSITGGGVYRGSQIPGLDGHYLFGDYCSGTLWTLAPDGPLFMMAKVLETDLKISSFGVTGAGEMVVVDHEGSLWEVAPL